MQILVSNLVPRSFTGTFFGTPCRVVDVKDSFKLRFLNVMLRVFRTRWLLFLMEKHSFELA
jgi:hypothetical protein